MAGHALVRLVRHALHAPVKGRFPKGALEAIQQAIAEGEQRHDGEVCFVVEARLPLRALLAAQGARARAEDLFGHLRVWDTARRTGVLVYVLLADRAIEIVTDRGAARRVPGSAWDVAAQVMQKHFREDDWRGGALAGLETINASLVRHLPPVAESNVNELPDQPLVL